MNNRLYNCKNPYQSVEKRVLCVCGAGLLRSPTAANVLHATYGFNTRSCGLDVGHALIPLDNVLIHWADEVVFMELRHLKAAEHLFPEIKEKTTLVLSIPDSYGWNSPTLRTLILEQYSKNILHTKEVSE